MVCETLSDIAPPSRPYQPASQTHADPPTLTPAVAPEKSVYPDYIICLEDGKQMKMLKRHLARSYGMTPDQYRAKWGLPASYPLVAPNYSKTRSQLAKDTGLGLHVVDRTARKQPRGHRN